MNDFTKDESDMICGCVMDWLSEHMAWIPETEDFAFISYDADELKEHVKLATGILRKLNHEKTEFYESLKFINLKNNPIDYRD